MEGKPGCALTFIFGNGGKLDVDSCEFGVEGWGAIIDRLAVANGGVVDVEKRAAGCPKVYRAPKGDGR